MFYKPFSFALSAIAPWGLSSACPVRSYEPKEAENKSSAVEFSLCLDKLVFTLTCNFYKITNEQKINNILMLLLCFY